MWQVFWSQEEPEIVTFQELESLLTAWFKETRASIAVISGSLLRAKTLHISTRLSVNMSQPLVAGLMVLNGDTVLYKSVSGCCKTVDSSTLEV